MSMKTTSTMMSVLGIITSVLYGWTLLNFIQAPAYLWVLWVFSMAVIVLTSIFSLWARDEYFADQFKTVLEKVKS
jgi:hypothetical protein